MVDVREIHPQVIDPICLDELAREGARRMIAAALRAEADQYVDTLIDAVDEHGHRLVRRNGHGSQRSLTVGSGTMRLRAPRVDDRRIDPDTGEKMKFTSSILPPYMRRSPKVSEVLPILYLRGLSTGDFRPALKELLGEDAAGLSPSSISRLIEQWEAEYRAFSSRRLDFVQYAYLFVDGVNVKIRLGDDDRLCLLVVIGVREDGRKELLTVADGYRESTESWAEVLRDLKDRGLGEPKLVTGDGALGVWAALGDVYLNAGHQRCWVHKIANVLDALPKRAQSQAKEMLHQIMAAPTRAAAVSALEAFRSEFGVHYPKAIAKLDRDWTQLVAFYDFPAEHWVHLRTTNPIESAFATVKLRTKVQKGAGSKMAALTMAYKLLDSAQQRWRTFNGASLIPEVLAGVKFKDGARVMNDETTTTDERVAA